MWLVTTCYRLHVCAPPKHSYVETFPNVMVSGAGCLGDVSHNAGALANELSVLLQEASESSLASTI